ncbi:MAG: VWA domain-containing protein [Lachnospiraceae bacterium]|nr:VWA domain-containing protein [Lachnospiraceae bacterium]
MERNARMPKWVLIALLLCGLIFNCLALPVLAEGDDDKPLDVVLVVDISNSMNTPDPNGEIVLRSALQDFVNCMHDEVEAGGSRIAVVCFNDKAAAYTVDGNGKPAFYAQSDLDGTANNDAPLTQLVSGVKYGGYTGVGNGLKIAVDLLEQYGRPEADSMIVLFSDGVDQMRDQKSLQEALENRTDAVAWLSNSIHKVPVNIIAFNFMNNKGENSLGEEGMQSLQTIADRTGGKLIEVNNGDDIHSAFLQFLGIEVVPIQLPIIEKIESTPEVVEIDISIIAKNQTVFSDGDIELKRPDGTMADLKGDPKYGYFLSGRFCTIKMYMPETGIWELIINAEGEADYGLVYIPDMSVKFAPSTSAGMISGGDIPVYRAYKDQDVIRLEAQLVGKNDEPVDGIYYDNDKLEYAKMMVVPKDGSQTKEIEMVYDAKTNALVAEQTMDWNCECDVTARIKTMILEKEYTFKINAGNYPLEVIGDFEKVTVDKGKTVSIDDIYRVVSDKEGDVITVAITGYEPMKNSDLLTAKIDGDRLEITGNGWGSVILTLTYTDAQGNSENVYLSVHSVDRLAILLLSLIPVLIGICVGVVLYLSYIGTSRIPGRFVLSKVSFEKEGQDTNESPDYIPVDNLVIESYRVCRGRTSDFSRIARGFSTELTYIRTMPEEQKNRLKDVLGSISSDNPFAKEYRLIGMVGTPMGMKGFTMKIDSRSRAQIEYNRGRERSGPGKYDFHDARTFRLVIPDGRGVNVVISLSYNPDSDRRRRRRGGGRTAGRASGSRGQRAGRSR